MKTCRTCGEEKGDEDFKKVASYKNKKYYSKDCRPCDSRKAQAGRYGISVDDIHALIKKAGNRCEICGTHADDISHNRNKHAKLYLDHNHTTGEVRGLLCGSCNSAIGMLQDDPAILMKAALYLQERGTY